MEGEYKMIVGPSLKVQILNMFVTCIEQFDTADIIFVKNQKMINKFIFRSMYINHVKNQFF